MTVMPKSVSQIAGMKVTIMGLGLHGGGLSSAVFFSNHGAQVTVTDLRDSKTLERSLSELEGRNIRFVLGNHEVSDFTSADVVIKNPAVKRNSPFLAAARCIETDISVFLHYSQSPLVAVTGSKGKSSTASAIHHGLVHCGIRSLLGGNITLSPLTFLDATCSERPVVLELSSWQLADMRGMAVLKPRVAVLTAIMPDHMNYYASMEEYVSDKRLIYADQDSGDCTICDRDSSWGRSFALETKARVLWYSSSYHEEIGAWLEPVSDDKHGYRGIQRLNPEKPEAFETILGEELLVPGIHMKKNLLAAALAMGEFGIKPADILKSLSSFPGVEHRLEYFAADKGIRWYNDSASTIPQAVEAALTSFQVPVVLISGGTDKNIDFSTAAQSYGKASSVVLLAGTGTDKLMPRLKELGILWSGPYESLDEAIAEAMRLAQPGSVVVFSPGCTSFGMFLHEFDRGKKFKDAVMRNIKSKA
jgi:UDP-N-acetylmuramoylalanine--D-glutamate ligase